MALNMCEMWFNGIKIAFFSKNYKKSPNSWGLFLYFLNLKDPKPPAAGGPTPRTPVCDTFELHWISQNVSKVTYLHFSTISLSPLPLQNPG